MWKHIFCLIALVWPFHALQEVTLIDYIPWSGPIKDVAWSPDGEDIFISAEDGVWRYDPRDLNEPPEAIYQKQAVPDKDAAYKIMEPYLQFSPDGTSLVSEGMIWDAQSGDLIREIPGARIFINADRLQVAAIGTAGCVQIHDAAVGRLVATLEPEYSCRGVKRLTASPDGNFLLVMGRGAPSHLWDLRTMTQVRLPYDSFNYWSWPGGMDFSPDSRWIVLGLGNGDIQYFPVDNLEDIHQVSAHSGGVAELVFSPDGTLLASGGADGIIRIWDFTTGTSKAVLQPQGAARGAITGLAFSPDGEQLVSSDEFGVLRLWNLTMDTWVGGFQPHNLEITAAAYHPGGNIIATASENWTISLGEYQKERMLLAGHSNTVNDVAFSPDGALLASASDDGTVRLWETTSGLEVALLEGHHGSVRQVTFYPSGITLASASWDHTVRIWDMDGQEIKVLTGHEDTVEALAYHPEGTLLASADYSGTIRLWDTDSYEAATVIQTEEHLPITALAFSPDGNYLAAANWYDSINLWDVETGELAATLIVPGRTRLTALAFSPDGAYLGAGGGDGTAGMIYLWEAETWELSSVIRGHEQIVTDIAFNPQTNILMSVSADQQVSLWDYAGQAELQMTRHGNPFLAQAIAFNPDNQLLAAMAYRNTVLIWQPGADPIFPGGRETPIKALAFSPDGRYLAAGGTNRPGINVWSTESGELYEYIFPGGSSIEAVAFSPDGTFLVGGGIYGEIYVSNFETGENVAYHRIDSGRRIRTLAISPGEQTVIFTADHGTVITHWDYAANTERVPNDAWLSFALSPDDHVLATSEGLWDIRQNTRLYELPLEPEYVAAFSPDGRWLAIDTPDHEILLLDVLSGETVLTIPYDSTFQMYQLTFNADSTRLATVDQASTIWVWEIE
ncbi:MAG: hypothetical protein KJ064_27560 [Anaerolineae bacterium]|nr:hypothetical protein [Anaerolineae bacterium]